MNKFLIAMTATMLTFASFAQEGTSSSQADSKATAPVKKKAKNKKKKATKGVTKVLPPSVKSSVVAEKSIASSETKASIASAPVAQTLSTDAAKTAEAKKHLTLEFTSVLDAASGTSISDAHQDVVSYAAIGWKFDDINRIVYKQYMAYARAAADSKEVQKSGALTNPMLIYGRNLGSLSGSDPADFQLRMIAPSLDMTNPSPFDIIAVQPQLDATWTLNPKIQVEYTLRPGFGFSADSAKNYSKLGINNLSLIYNFNDQVSVYQALGLCTDNFNGPGKYYLEGGIQIVPNKNVIILANMQQNHSHVAKNDFVLYDTNESLYELGLTLLY